MPGGHVRRADTYEAKVNRNVTIDGAVPVSAGQDVSGEDGVENAEAHAGSDTPDTESREDSTEHDAGKVEG